jgi:hypothetical protein
MLYCIPFYTMPHGSVHSIRLFDVRKQPAFQERPRFRFSGFVCNSGVPVKYSCCHTPVFYCVKRHAHSLGVRYPNHWKGTGRFIKEKPNEQFGVKFGILRNSFFEPAADAEGFICTFPKGLLRGKHRPTKVTA